jgi:hypothetical protein
MTHRQHAWQPPASTCCPFLLEEAAQFCRLAPCSTLVPSRRIATEVQRCSSAAWSACALVPRSRAPRGGPGGAALSAATPADRCPFLAEIAACSCAAAPSGRLLPGTRLAVRRCRGDSHRYCDVFLEYAGGRAAAGTAARPAANGLARGEAIPIAPGVAVAPNHMWLDVGPDGGCHVGVDAFLARVLGPVDEIAFLSRPGPGSPRVVLTVAGASLPIAFPAAFDIACANRALRWHVDRLTADPYGRGWLYEGTAPGGRGGNRLDTWTTGLRRGPGAEAWMASEVRRLERHLHATLSRRGGQLGPTLNDGGEIAAPLPRHLERAELVEIFGLFFAGAPG